MQTRVPHVSYFFLDTSRFVCESLSFANESCGDLQKWDLVHLGIDEMSAAANTELALQWRRGRFLNELRYKSSKEAITIFFDTWINSLFNIASVQYHPWQFLYGSIHKHFNTIPSPTISFYRMKRLILNIVFHLNSINIWCNYRLPLFWCISFSLLSVVLESCGKFENN